MHQLLMQKLRKALQQIKVWSTMPFGQRRRLLLPIKIMMISQFGWRELVIPINPKQSNRPINKAPPEYADLSH